MPRKIVKSGLVGLLSLAGCVTNPYSPYQYANDLNNRQQIKQQTQQPQNMFIACNSWSDSDGDGYVDYPDEIIGKKDNFFTNEYVTLASRIFNEQGRLLDLKVYGAGRDLFEHSFGRIANNDNFFFYRCKPGSLGDGFYRANWFFDGRFIEGYTFSVTDKYKHIKNLSSYLQSQNIVNFVIYKKEGNKTEFAGGTMMPIGKGEYVKFIDNNDKPVFVSSYDRKFTSLGELVKVSQDKPSVVRLEYDNIEFYVEEIPEYEQTHDVLHINYADGNITTKPARKITE